MILSGLHAAHLDMAEKRHNRKPLHRCACGALISATKKYCGPCAGEMIDRRNRQYVAKKKRETAG